MLPFVSTARQHAVKTAVIDTTGSYTYEQLLGSAQAFAHYLLQNEPDLKETRVAYMISSGFDYVRVQWGIWLAGGIAVPLCTDHPLPALQYTLSDAQVEIVVTTEEYTGTIRPLAESLNIRFLQLEEMPKRIAMKQPLPELQADRKAMILYTSGTTNQPKGVVSTLNNIRSQVGVLQHFWEWTDNDHILCVLPLHHTHGIINVVNCSLWSGATCEFITPFSAKAVFQAFLKGQINVFMAVPTIYYKLIAYFDTLSEAEQTTISRTLKDFRLMVSGSAALPVSVMERWHEISGHWLLERYGMTEIGMALSNPYREERYPGHVGLPLPGVELRIRTEDDREVVEGEPGEIQIKGPAVFVEYWNKPRATAESFTEDGWFRTGDMAQLDAQKGYRILGRNSVDIIKSGGYKISALEIEEVLRRHQAIDDCAVVGIPDEEWGEIIGAALVTTITVDLEELKNWLKTYLPAYRLPRRYLWLTALPRNAMGKVTKKAVVQLFEEQ
ncbi:MAG: acyl-CoA synthetase [Saprospiraceae bacterium]